jgi:hypothetical protein
MSRPWRVSLRDWLIAIFSPTYWTRIYPTSKALSDFIEARLDSGELPVIRNLHEMELGGVMLWRANHPYGYGTTTGGLPSDKRLPRRAVARRLRTAEVLVTRPKVRVDLEASIRDALQERLQAIGRRIA